MEDKPVGVEWNTEGIVWSNLQGADRLNANTPPVWSSVSSGSFITSPVLVCIVVVIVGPTELL